MAKITEAAGNIAAELLANKGQGMEDHIKALGDADEDLGTLLTMYGSGAAQKIRAIMQAAAKPERLVDLDEAAMNSAGEAYLNGIIFGIKMAAAGFHFEATPEGVKLHHPEGTETC